MAATLSLMRYRMPAWVSGCANSSIRSGSGMGENLADFRRHPLLRPVGMQAPEEGGFMPAYRPVKPLATQVPGFSSPALGFDLEAFFWYSVFHCRMSLNLQLDGEAWSAVLTDLSHALGKEGSPVRLCLIGSAACLFGGMDGRTSADLDIWKPASDYDRAEL